MDLAEQAEKTLIAADMRVFLNLINPRFQRIQGVAALVLMPFFSAVILDSYYCMAKKSPELARAIESNREILTDSRLRLKPLEIHSKRFEEVLRDTNHLARINSAWFKNSHPRVLRFIYRFIRKDLGIYFMNEEILCTTHLTFMNLGITEETLHRRSLSLSNMAAYLREISEDYGRYLSDLYVSLADEISDGNEIGVDYVDQILALGDLFSLVLSRDQVDASLVDESLSIPYRDLHSEPFYEQIAKTRGPEQNAAFILVLAALSQINTARILRPKVSEGNDVSGLKTRFLYLYHAAHTLNILSNQGQRSRLLYPQALTHVFAFLRFFFGELRQGAYEREPRIQARSVQ